MTLHNRARQNARLYKTKTAVDTRSGSPCSRVEAAAHLRQDIKACRLYRRLTGTMLLRTASFGACRLMASCAVHSLVQKRSISGTRPTVDTVILFLLKCRPSGCVAISIAVITASMLSSGSPAYGSAVRRRACSCRPHKRVRNKQPGSHPCP